jgi:uncharacterized membrane protein HdeD (DUF308 family)
LANFGQGQYTSRFATGAANVTYNDDGRLNIGAPQSVAAPAPAGRSSNFFWRSNDAATTQNTRTRWSFLPWNRGGAQTTTYGTGVATAPLVTRTRYDDYSVMPGLGYREYMRPEPTRQQTVVTERRMALPAAQSDQLVVEEMKVYTQHPPWWWLFIIDGILLIILGVINILFCVDMHYFCRFWTGAMLIIFGILGAIHRGDYYRRKWKSYFHIIFGILTAAAVYACLAFAMSTFCHQLIEIAQFNDKDAYIAEMKFRYEWLQIKPWIILNDDVETNIWVCFALDGITLILLTIGFLVLTSVCYVIDRFYNSNWVITRKVEPFCSPSIFNPWGQVSLGQAQIFIGMVLNASVHGNNLFLWQRTYAPVWSGIIPIVAGIFTALSLKSCGLKHRCWNWTSIILELISAIVSIIAIILVVVGMIQNIQTLQESTVMNYTDFANRMMLASTFLFCISALACLVNVFYSIALLIRLIICVCCSKNETRNMDVQYIYDDSAANLMIDEKKTYGGVWNRDPRANFVVDQFESPYRIGQDTRTYTVD